MKEKIKNFLLKIKKSLCTEIKTPVYKIMLFGIIMIVLSCISFSCANFVSNSLNYTHIQQVEEIPQTETMRIEKDLKFANPTSSDYINPNNTYNVIYCNNTLDNETIYNDLLTFYNLYGSNFLPIDNSYVYPFYAYYEFGDSNPYSICFVYEVLPYGVGIAIMTFNLNSLEPYQFWYSSFIEDNNVLHVNIPLPTFMLPSMIMATITPFSSFNFGGIDVPIGALNQVLFSNFSSKQFEINSTPTLENAPISLVNTIPSNAVTTLPTTLGTKIYDSGSGLTMTDGGNEYNTFGFQIYYDSTIKTNETELYQFTIDGVTYNVEPYVYRYYLNDVNIVIYTLWNNTPIYYVFEDVLLEKQFPFTLDYETRFDFSNLSNVFASSVYIVNTYSDYVHINIEFGYYMSLNHSGDVVYLIDTEETGIEALIYSTTHSGNYGDKGFDLDIIPQLDPRYSKMGQTQTDNMYSTIVHGGTINSVWSNAYHKGIDVGTADGYSDGYNDGVETGKTLQNPINPIMDFISDGASVISNVFSFEIFPNISLGTMLLFPLAIALIWFVIKLFMGG